MTDRRSSWVVAVGGPVVTAWLRTVRFRVVAGQTAWDETWGRRRPALFLLWHGRLLPCAFFHRYRGLATLISEHRDGELIARLVQRWGYTTLRGSSTRGAAAALRQVLRSLGAGQAVAVTPDGPQGPREHIKPNILLAAQRSGAPIVLVTAGARHGLWFESWDRFLVPLPGTRAAVAYDGPFFLPSSLDEEELRRWKEFLEARLRSLTDRVDAEA